MHILFVEDEAKIANFVQAGLKEQGFVVDYCDNGDEGYTRALDNESSPERKSWNTSGAMISIPIPTW